MVWNKAVTALPAMQLRLFALLLLFFVVDYSVIDYSIAQPIFFGNETPRETSAVMVGYSAVDLDFDGEAGNIQTYSFDSPVYTITYSRASLFASLALGRQDAADTTESDLSYIDFTAAFSSEMFFSEAATQADHRIFVPITLYTNYRKVAPRGEEVLEEFNITTLGLGLGLGYYGLFGDDIRIEARSTPVIGISVRSFGDSAGYNRLLDNDLQIHLGSLFDSIGVSLGYRYRVMIWDVNTSSVFGELSVDLFNYRESSHTFSLGLNW